MNLILKLLGAGLVVLVGTGFGWQKSFELRSRAQALRQLLGLIRRIQEEIEFRATPLPQLLEYLRQSEEFPLLCLGECPSLRQWQPPAIFNKAQQEAVLPFFRQLGQVGSAESAGQAEYYLHLCQQWLEEARQECSVAEKLYIKLGLCGGLMAALMLL